MQKAAVMLGARAEFQVVLPAGTAQTEAVRMKLVMLSLRVKGACSFQNPSQNEAALLRVIHGKHASAAHDAALHALVWENCDCV